MASRTAMAWLITALLLASVLAVPLASGQQSDASSEWTLSDLQKQGEVTDTRYPSLRVAGEMEAFWLVRYPPRGTGTYGDQNSKKYIKPTTTVQRNKVRLYASFPFDSQNRTFSLTKVYWHPDSRQVQTDNGTVVTKRYANVTAVGTQNVTFQSGMRRHSEVLLRGHYDDAERVTMLLSLPDGNTLRWTFKHKSIPTAKAAPDISSRGDLNEYILLWVVLPTLLLSFISYKKVPKFRREALAGTGRGAGTWIAMGFVVAIGAYLLGYYALASLTAHFPVVFSLFIAYVVAVMQLEDDEDAVETWGFIRIDPETATSPLDDKSEVLDSGDIEIEGYDVVFDENNEPVLYSRGLLSMWARYKGCYARLNIDNKEAEWNCVGDYDKVIVVDQDAPALVEHLPSRVIFAWPWRTYQPPRNDDGELLEDDLDPGKFRVLPESIGAQQYAQLAGMVAVPAMAAFASMDFVGAWQWGPLTCLPFVLMFAEPIEGKAQSWVAPGQARKAWVTAWYTDLNVRRFGTIDQLLEKLIESENKQYDVEDWLRDLREDGVVNEAHNRQSKPFDTVLSDDDPALDRDDEPSTAAAGGDD
ncbi:hypothetical protein ACFQJ5_00140 [Halomicroarcula sp. GCM10025324]|uniref:hypothetical protein n=2 Tax=Haloarcula TaxID=2237 RepID=UPI0023E8B208|nr:hypothetical protein [Halomicroarcula sp. ZS-22-S1]